MISNSSCLVGAKPSRTTQISVTRGARTSPRHSVNDWLTSEVVTDDLGLGYQHQSPPPTLKTSRGARELPVDMNQTHTDDFEVERGD